MDKNRRERERGKLFNRRSAWGWKISFDDGGISNSPICAFEKKLLFYVETSLFEKIQKLLRSLFWTMDLSLLQFTAAGFLVRLGTSSFPAKQELLLNLLPSWERAQIKSDEVQVIRWQCINCRAILVIMKQINLTLRIKFSYMYTTWTKQKQ